MRDVEVLDEATRQSVTNALLRASLNGQDPAEYLHRYGLLATPAMKRKIRADTVDAAADGMEKAAIESLNSGQLLAVLVTVTMLRRLARDIREEKRSE